MHLMEVKGAKPGRFKPRCPSCKRKFALMVPENEHEAPVVEIIPQTVSRRDEGLTGDITDALGIEKTPEPQRKAKPKKAVATASSATSASVTAPPPSSAPSQSSAATMPPASSSSDSSITAAA